MKDQLDNDLHRSSVGDVNHALRVGKLLKDTGKDLSKHKARYLYAVVAATEDLNYADCGLGGGNVYTVPNGKVAAVVSDIRNEKIRPERRNLAAHQDILRRIMKETTPLPMAFGIIANSTESVQKILSENRQAFVRQLKHVANRVEMGLRVTWNMPNIFEYFVDNNPELRAARDRLFGFSREPTQQEKMELGRMFERTLSGDREAHTEKVEEVLLNYCYDVKRNKCSRENDVMKLACLVGRDSDKDFEHAVLKAANLFDDNCSFDYNGPWPPYNFVEMKIKL